MQHLDLSDEETAALIQELHDIVENERMLTVLDGRADVERDLICTRTAEGRARAVARGQKMGRPFKLTDHQKREAIKRRDRDGEPVREIARSYNVSHSTISRLTP